MVQAGFVVSNSEVGLVCKNGLICKDFAQKKYHVGRQVNASDDMAYEIYSEATLAQDDRAFFMKVQDVVKVAVDEARFMLTVDKMREATQILLKHEPEKQSKFSPISFSLRKMSAATFSGNCSWGLIIRAMV